MPGSNLTYRRGEIRRVNLEPTVGTEAKKIRMCDRKINIILSLC
ncbi:hypothetical protein [Nostoc sp.]